MNIYEAYGWMEDSQILLDDQFAWYQYGNRQGVVPYRFDNLTFFRILDSSNLPNERRSFLFFTVVFLGRIV